MLKRSENNRRGSVLMETILVIPVLLVLLGGVLWLGQLQINRARLLAADRYMAWNLANRHRFPEEDPAGSDATMLRLELKTNGIFAGDWGEIEQEVLHSSVNSFGANGFSHHAEGLVAMKVTAPKMVSSMFSATSIMDPEQGGVTNLSVSRLDSLTNHFVVALRAQANYVQAGGSRFIVPVPGDAYSKGKEELRLDYESVAAEPWSLNVP
jgi:hypothetical protein